MNKPVIKSYISSLSPLKKKANTIKCGRREGKEEGKGEERKRKKRERYSKMFIIIIRY